AVSWAEAGISTPKQAAKSAGKYDKAVYAIMKALGKSGTPTKAEADFANRWLKEYGFTQDIITEACTRTVMATDKHRFEYADSILSSWRKKNVHNRADIAELDSAYAKSKTAPKAQGNSAGARNLFNQFMHTDYDFETLEQEILSN
ncbi:MAG: DnaD domain protein, partial [Clostridium sp.]|nr:DnaD domain protein [Clostridium sp.]